MRNTYAHFFTLRTYWLPVALCIVCTYGLYLFLSDAAIAQVGEEDQFFENLTALLFAAASTLFLACFFVRRNGWFLLLALVFFVGFGEEIAWGQRILGFQTPRALDRMNVQHEFTFHNIEIFDANDSRFHLKTGAAKLLTINFLYKLFWLTYCILLPVLGRVFRRIDALCQSVRLPVPPAAIGVWFAFNWIVFKATSVWLLPVGKSEQYYDTIGEMAECISAVIFMIVAAYFFDWARGHDAAGPSRPQTERETWGQAEMT